MKFGIASLAIVATIINGAAAFSLQTRWTRAPRFTIPSVRPSPRLFLADQAAAASQDDSLALTDVDRSFVQSLWNQSHHDESLLQDLVLQALPSMSAKLIMALKKEPTHLSSIAMTHDNPDEAIQRVATALQSLLDDRLSQGREVLASLLSAGELRKLDAEIGKANRAGKLDMAFFTVLDMNLKDAAAAAAATEEESAAAVEAGGASRLSVLTHVYTRCHEEVESALPPGTVLLNKLLRTASESIRANQLQYYLCPLPDVITLPDGQVIPVAKKDNEKRKALVAPSLLVEALASTVQQIRTIEKAEGMTREAAANMVEACRTVAKEARLVVAKEYGIDSETLLTFEQGLQPVFRPVSAESEFVQGV